MINDSPEEKAKQRIRQLIWAYFWLLIIEGALRKWVMPRFSNPLLIIRDPVMLAIYYYSIRAHVFPKNGWSISLYVIGFCSVLAIFLSPIFDYLPWSWLIALTAYGFRTDFMHLPIIFVMASVFDEEDVKKFGWWILIVMIPMSLIMVAQFEASPDSFINRTVGLGEGEQLTAGGGKIRPPGTFSFISGTVYYISVAAAFLIYGALTRGYKNWLLIVSGVALVVGVVISGSRSCVVAVLIVVMAVGVIFLFRWRSVNRFGQTLLIVVIGAVLISRLPIFKEGVQILSDRFTESAAATETTVTKGLVERIVGGFTEALGNVGKVPFWGYGLGIGTNVGGRILVGHAAFLLNENEWTRVLQETGPVLGLAFLLWRTLLTWRLGSLSFRALRRGNLLPILVFSSGFVLLLSGQLGQATTLGFATFLSGLCLAATRPRADDSEASAVPELAQSAPRSLPRRSAYANRLHGPEIGAEHNNGSADR